MLYHRVRCTALGSTQMSLLFESYLILLTQQWYPQMRAGAVQRSRCRGTSFDLE